MKSRSRARSHLFAACLVTALAAGVAACGSDEAEHTLVGYRPSGVQQVDTVEIPDVSAAGEPFVFRAEPGQLLLVSFGYTQCPDVCPTTLAAIRGGLRLIGDQADDVALAMVTVDPFRDTDEVLTPFVQSFVPDAHALRTDDAQLLRQVADLFGVSYSVSTDADGVVRVAHSGFVYVIDDTGAVRLSWPFGVSSADIAGDLQFLFAEGTPA